MILLFACAAEAAATDCFCYLIIIIHRQVIVKNTLGNALALRNSNSLGTHVHQSHHNVTFVISIIIIIGINNTEHLNRVVARLSKVRDVLKVTRS